MKYYASPKIPEMWARTEWCKKMFGSQWCTGHRWYRNKGRIYFRNEEDLTLFLLRWA